MVSSQCPHCGQKANVGVPTCPHCNKTINWPEPEMFFRDCFLRFATSTVSLTVTSSFYRFHQPSLFVRTLASTRLQAFMLTGARLCFELNNHPETCRGPCDGHDSVIVRVLLGTTRFCLIRYDNIRLNPCDKSQKIGMRAVAAQSITGIPWT